MTGPMTLSQILLAASQLSVEQQLELNKGLCEMIRRSRRAQATVLAAKFVPGQIIRFVKSGRGRHAGLHYVKVDGFNRAGTCIVGYECDAQGNKLPLAVKWTVATTSCTLHTPAAK